MFNFTLFDACKFLSLNSQVIFGHTEISVFCVMAPCGMFDSYQNFVDTRKRYIFALKTEVSFPRDFGNYQADYTLS
jgi:hypothetical protein